MDGTRKGEPLAALVGQQFERDLHARQLDLLIAPLRADFPLVAGKTSARDGPAELVAAGNVVDGLALRLRLERNGPAVLRPRHPPGPDRGAGHRLPRRPRRAGRRGRRPR